MKTLLMLCALMMLGALSFSTTAGATGGPTGSRGDCSCCCPECCCCDDAGNCCDAEAASQCCAGSACCAPTKQE